MPLSIVNNVSALNAQNNLAKTASRQNQSIERLSSGFRVNRGADSPAALVISEKQRAQIAGLRTAIDNSEKASSVVQAAEGALAEINNILVKMRSLAIDSANAGVNDNDTFNANQAEIADALFTVTRIATNTQVGERKLLDGSAALVGTADNASVSVTEVGPLAVAGEYAVVVTSPAERAVDTAATTQTTGLAATENLTINGVSITLTSGLSQSQVVSRINDFTAQTGVFAEASSNQLTFRSTAFGTSASISVVSDTAAGTSGNTTGVGTTPIVDSGENVAGTIDGAAAAGLGETLTSTTGDSNGVVIAISEASAGSTGTATGALGSVTVTDNSLVFQVGANRNQTAQIFIQSVSAEDLGASVAGNQFSNLAGINITSAANSQDALEVIDSAIDEVTKLRGRLGAFQSNTLESTAANSRTVLENTINAESIIRDTDFAEEISALTSQQVLFQAGTSVLSNANQTAQGFIALLEQ